RRCGARLHPRRPYALARTWALLITAAILYIPANVLPIMTVHSFGQGSPDTIMSGVVALAQNGMVPIAIVVLVASILVPTWTLVDARHLRHCHPRRPGALRQPGQHRGRGRRHRLRQCGRADHAGGHHI